MRIGVYVCHCGSNIAGVVNPEEVRESAEELPDVVVARDLRYSCSDDGQEQIKEDIEEHELDRLVVAACSPKLHEPTFRRTAESAGLNPYQFEMANIREHCSWPHSQDPVTATQKAKDLVRMAVAKVRHLEPLERETVPADSDVLVIGGGVAGISAALDLADGGINVHLVEKKPTIGGHMARLDEVFPTLDCSICVLAPRMADVQNHPNITMHTYSEVVDVEGEVGNYHVRVKQKPRYVVENECTGCEDCSEVCPIEVPSEFEYGVGARKAAYVPYPQAVPKKALIDPEACVGCGLCEEACQKDAIDFDQEEETVEFDVGGIIVATGWQGFDPSRKPEYGYEEYEDVVTNLELERIICASGPTEGKLRRPSNQEVPERVAFIQCVGSRDEQVGNEYCSRVCCMAALKLAQIIKNKHPETEVVIHYIDMRTDGEGYEEFYKRAQEMGIKFVRGRVAEVVEKDDQPHLRYEDTLAGEVREDPYDLVVLSVALENNSGEMTELLNMHTRPDGFLAVAHPKMRPVETNQGGIFVAGCASGPKEVQTSIAQGSAAAGKAMQLLGKGEIVVEPTIAQVNTGKCVGCRICERVCAFNSIEVREKKARVKQASCTGCGVCSAGCPESAIDMPNFTDQQILSQIEAALEVKSEYPYIVGFLCNWCSYGAADLAGTSRQTYPTNVRPIRVMCAGRVNPRFVVEALKRGADGVLVTGCRMGECHYLEGNYQARHRFDVLREVIEELGFNPGRLRTEWMSAGEGSRWAETIESFVEELREIGPIGEELDER